MTHYSVGTPEKWSPKEVFAKHFPVVHPKAISHSSSVVIATTSRWTSLSRGFSSEVPPSSLQNKSPALLCYSTSGALRGRSTSANLICWVSFIPDQWFAPDINLFCQQEHMGIGLRHTPIYPLTWTPSRQTFSTKCM